MNGLVHQFGMLILLSVFASSASAQVIYPLPPDEYAVTLRYRIRAGETQRIVQYRALQERLKAVNFVENAREDADLDIYNTTAEILSGTIPSRNVDALQRDPRVESILLMPKGRELVDGEATEVRLGLRRGLEATQQRLLHEQTARHLQLLGFVEGVAYDDQGFTLIRGTMPSDNVMSLLKDLRYQPTGWFAPVVPVSELPLPLRQVTPIRRIEVLPNEPKVNAVPPTPIDPSLPQLVKLDAPLRSIYVDPAQQNKPLRVDAVLDAAPGQGWPELRYKLRTVARDAGVEGLVGPIATVRLARTSDLLALATLPEIVALRLPPVATSTTRITTDKAMSTTQDWLDFANLTQLHQRGYRGQGVKVAVIAAEFPKSEQPIINAMKRIDLTAELNPDITPAPANAAFGNGTHAAEAVHLGAPEANVILVRIDPTAFHQLMTVANAVAGSSDYSEALQSRSLELAKRGDEIRRRRVVVNREYRQALSDLGDEPAKVQRRQQARAALEAIQKEEAEFARASLAFNALKNDLDALSNTHVVVNTLVWDTGYPQDGLSDLARLLDAKFTPKPVRSALRAYSQPPVPVWVQAASMSIGQVWAGPYLDRDGDNVMEFARPDAQIPVSQWTNELTFLGTDKGLSLPAGLKLRATLQWREPREPGTPTPALPSFPIVIRLLKQLDPEGKTFPSDEMVEVSRSVTSPIRLLQTQGSAAYEQSLFVTIPTDGVYALRIERPSVEQGPRFGPPIDPEIAARLVVDSIGDNALTPKLRSYVSPNAGVGLPGGSRSVLTVGVASQSGLMQSLSGAGPSTTLLVKPDALLPDAITIYAAQANGTSMAAGLAGGMAASLDSGGIRITDIISVESLKPGSLLRIPEIWISNLAQRP